MGKIKFHLLKTGIPLIIIFLLSVAKTLAQEQPVKSSPLPENISKIVNYSCMPCHSAKGGLLSKSKLNFDDWTSYEPDFQKKKAEAIYKEVSKRKMPPKMAVENNPDIVPTDEQIAAIKKWVDKFPADK